MWARMSMWTRGQPWESVLCLLKSSLLFLPGRVHQATSPATFFMIVLLTLREFPMIYFHILSHLPTPPRFSPATLPIQCHVISFSNKHGVWLAGQLLLSVKPDPWLVPSVSPH